MVTYKSTVDRIYQYLFIAAFFLLPLTVVGNNIVIWLIALLWLFSGDYSNKLQKIKNNKLALASIVFFCIHILGLLWTENIEWGLEILRKMLPFLFILPIFLTITRKENAKYYVSAFLIAITISEFLSYLIWFGIIEPFGSASVSNPTPLINHVSYNPFLAFAIYLVIHFLLTKKNLSQFQRAGYTFFVLTMTINMFITGGRAGQVMFFVFIVILAFQYFKNSQIKAIITSIVLGVSISLIAYNTSTIFKERVDLAAQDVINYESNKKTAVGYRIAFVINSLELVKKSPLHGVGTGDFPDEYSKVNQKLTPGLTETVQPHNMYMLILAQLGLIGFISFMSMFYFQFKIALTSDINFVHNVGVAIPLLFLTIMWSDSYLLGHFTSYLYILFSSFIYGSR